MVTAAMKLKEIKSFSWKKSYDKSRQCIKKQRHHFADKGLYSLKAMVFPVVMYGCKSWTMNKASVKDLILSNCGEGERTDTEAEAPILWPHDVKS